MSSWFATYSIARPKILNSSNPATKRRVRINYAKKKNIFKEHFAIDKIFKVEEKPHVHRIHTQSSLENYNTEEFPR
jgi:hypothetical protein